jgi:hypothetical protein
MTPCNDPAFSRAIFHECIDMRNIPVLEMQISAKKSKSLYLQQMKEIYDRWAK